MTLDYTQQQFRYADWSFQQVPTPKSTLPIASDCSIPDYILDAAYSEANHLHLSHRAAASYRCYLLACLTGLNELFWAHHQGHNIQDVLRRHLDNCFSTGQCWRYTTPLLVAAVDDLPKMVSSKVGIEDAWDWVDAAFNEGLLTGHIYDFTGYRQRASAICRFLIETVWGAEGVTLEALYRSEGLLQSLPRIELLTAFEVAELLEQFGCPGASSQILEIVSRGHGALIQCQNIPHLVALLKERGVGSAFAAVADAVVSQARRSSGAISNSVFRTIGS